MIGLHMVFAYFKMGRVIALIVETINFFCLPHLVEVSAFRRLSVCFAIVMTTSICCKNVSFGSRVIFRIFACFVVGNVWLFILSKARQFGGTNLSASKFVGKSICRRANLSASQFGGEPIWPENK